LGLCAWGLLAALAGCSFLANEFSTLDRAAPAPSPAAAAAVNDRP
jgi:hypothetical protein